MAKIKEKIVIDDSLTIEKTTEEKVEKKIDPNKVISSLTNDERRDLKANYPVSNIPFEEGSGECRICGKPTNLRQRILCYECFNKYKNMI